MGRDQRRGARREARLPAACRAAEQAGHPLQGGGAVAQSASAGVAALGLSAIARRDDVPEKWTDDAIKSLSSSDWWVQAFVYRALVEQAKKPVIGPVLAKLSDETDTDSLARFIQQRRERGEEVGVDTFRGSVSPGLVEPIELFINRYETYLGDDFRGHFEEWRRTAVDLEFLTHIGRILERPYDDPPAYVAGRRDELVEVIVDALEQQPRRSVLLVGEHGVGKTALLRAALERLRPQLVPFEATAAEINAGAMYVGELEGRIRGATRGPSGRLDPAGLQRGALRGQHSRSPTGMLDAMLPHIERREMTVVGEIDPPSYEKPRRAAARRRGLRGRPVRPLDEQSTVAAAAQLLGSRASPGTLHEAFELAQQFLPGLAPPGNLLRLSRRPRRTWRRRAARVRDVRRSGHARLVLGLPLAMLDPSAPLELADVRAFFEGRVLAQPEAVDAIVERIAMIKAGLNDPTRPLGVYLFIGPTGTGKTEIAKALAEFLFGPQRRLVRLDMSEYQTPDSLERLLQDPSVESHGTVLLASVRKDPFAVILLDEFERRRRRSGISSSRSSTTAG